MLGLGALAVEVARVSADDGRCTSLTQDADLIFFDTV